MVCIRQVKYLHANTLKDVLACLLDYYFDIEDSTGNLVTIGTLFRHFKLMGFIYYITQVFVSIVGTLSEALPIILIILRIMGTMLVHFFLKLTSEKRTTKRQHVQEKFRNCTLDSNLWSGR